MFREHGGLMRTATAMRAGINPATLYALRDAGLVECLCRGLYRVSEAEIPEALDLLTVAARVPRAVICLISALDWHGLTTQIPHEVYVALERGARTPKLDHPPLKVFRVSEPCFSSGIETYEMAGVAVRAILADASQEDRAAAVFLLAARR